MKRGPRPSRSKVMTRERAAAWCRKARRRGERVVFTNGCFDLLHAGHIHSLESARALGDLLVVGLNSDASVRALKGAGRPVVAARHRARILGALECVDVVVQFRAATPVALIRALRPAVLAKGGDWSLDQIAGRSDVEGWGGRVVRLREIPGLRSTAILQQIRRAP